MNDTPPPISAPPTRAGELQRAASEPRWPLVVGIIAIAYGAIGVLSTIFGLAVAGLVPQPAPGAAPDPDTAMLDIFHSTGWLAFSATTGIATGVLLFIAGIGLIRRRRWSVVASKTWSWLTIAFTFIGALFAIYVVVVSPSSLTAEMTTGANPPPFAPGLFLAIAIISMAIGLIAAILFPVFLLVWFSRPRIRQQLAAWT